MLKTPYIAENPWTDTERGRPHSPGQKALPRTKKGRPRLGAPAVGPVGAETPPYA